LEKKAEVMNEEIMMQVEENQESGGVAKPE
jgi:hypothetical protein